LLGQTDAALDVLFPKIQMYAAIWITAYIWSGLGACGHGKKSHTVVGVYLRSPFNVKQRSISQSWWRQEI